MTSSPFQIQDFWSVATPGTTLCLLDGVYQGSTNRIAPPSSGLSGTNGKPITIRALNDGRVLIDGQHQRVPVSLPAGSSWFVLEGFNAARSSSTVISVRGSNNILRRIVAWDAHIARNADVWLIADSTAVNNLLEDVAGFGAGKNIFSVYRPGANNVCRRCWARWEGSTNYNFKRVMSTSYGDGLGIARCENCIAIWSAESMPETYMLTDAVGSTTTYNQQFTNYEVQLPGALYWYYGGTTTSVKSRVLGSIGIVPASTPGGSAPTTYALWANQLKSDVEVRHSFMFTHPSHPAFSSQKGYRFDGGSNVVASNITSVRGSSDNLTSVSLSNQSLGTSPSAVANPWTTTGAGANLCKRWKDGMVTNQPLWPWPMNDRIKAATATAGAYSGPCPSCTGGRRVRTATDVTAQVQALFGTIPQSCRTQ